MRGFIIFSMLLYSIAGYSLTCESIFNKIPERSYHNSKFEIKNAIATIASEYKVERIDLGDKLYVVKERLLQVNTKLPENFPTSLLILDYSVKTAATFIGLSPEAGKHLAGVVLKDAALALGRSWTQTLRDMELASLEVSYSFQKNLLSALEDILRLTEVDTDYEIPYLAGYSTHNAKKVYIDKDFKQKQIILYSEVSLVPFLVVHERVEKALLETLPITNDRYLISHQIAQRIEKAMALATNVEWDTYQNKIMQEEIKRAENPNRIFKKIPADIDRIPYEDAHDKRALKNIEEKAFTSPPNKLFDFTIVRPGVIHLSFHDQKQMAWTMMRFQEFYESPKFRGKIFSRKQFLGWFSRKKSGYKSYSEWDGFNIPNEILETFYAGKFNPLTINEKLLLQTLKNFRHTKFYIVATAGLDSPVISHEIAHSLFYFNENYRKEALDILKKTDTASIEKFLKEEIGDYHESVLLDEVHAWLAHDFKYLETEGFDISPYQETIDKLRSLYERYTH